MGTENRSGGRGPLQGGPCLHLTVGKECCELGREVPRDCREGCAAYLPALGEEERVRCEVWSRVMGYHRPVSAWNPGKQAEYAERRVFAEPGE